MKARRGLITGRTHNRMYFFALQIDGSITRGGGGISGGLRYWLYIVSQYFSFSFN